jgi:hypothetical protein
LADIRVRPVFKLTTLLSGCVHDEDEFSPGHLFPVDLDHLGPTSLLLLALYRIVGKLADIRALKLSTLLPRSALFFKGFLIL